jgi:pyruvate carboxylase
MGQPPGGFPKKIQKRILGDRKPVKGRPGASLPPVDFAETAQKVESIVKHKPSDRDVMSWLMYPKVFEDYASHVHKYSDTSGIPTPVFFFGQQAGEEFAVDIEPGKTLIVKFLTVGDPHADGERTVFFELNGQPRDVSIIDKSFESVGPKNLKADPDDPNQVGAGMPGMVVSVAVTPGEAVKKGQKLLTLEAMKMATNLQADRDGTIGKVLVSAGTQVSTGDLLLTYS